MGSAFIYSLQMVVAYWPGPSVNERRTVSSHTSDSTVVLTLILRTAPLNDMPVKSPAFLNDAYDMPSDSIRAVISSSEGL